MTWYEQALAAERRGDWDAAIGMVPVHAECYSTDSSAHAHHLWHMDLLVRAGRFTELADLALTDVHARRRLNKSLRDRRMAEALSERAGGGDRGALYHLVELLCETGRAPEASRAVRDFAPEDAYAQELLAPYRA
ncbi:hypothetical protein OHA37_11510 [Streptomyces sp. NBC_00335]|uniref:hypothetical protein n=1 Tax=unclassified Streptomyces TaxID=2593676 RepID=UPI00224E744A|nr:MULTISPECIES: hypothetical protein [unclassified Streptomyces]MCX5404507.1 hypothetical protein [Streptomyces sp. NBC_00086]